MNLSTPRPEGRGLLEVHLEPRLSTPPSEEGQPMGWRNTFLGDLQKMKEEMRTVGGASRIREVPVDAIIGRLTGGPSTPAGLFIVGLVPIY